MNCSKLVFTFEISYRKQVIIKIIDISSPCYFLVDAFFIYSFTNSRTLSSYSF